MATREESAVRTEVPIQDRLPAVRSPLDVTRASYKQFDDDLVQLVKVSIMPREATNAETYFLLQLAATYQLDPFAREIWAAKMKGKTGESGGVAILIGRDGLLSIAERHKSFRGFRCHAVYQHDTFAYDVKPRKMPDGTYTQVRHTFDVTADRGALVGAWAEVYREGRPTVFFFAPLGDYMPTSERKLEYTPWGSMKNVMIEKCALATALRVAFRITGLYIEEEMTNALTQNGDVVYEEPEWPEDPQLEHRLRQLFRVAEETKPGSWLPGKVSAALEACGGENDFRELEARLVEFIGQHGGEVPEEEEVIEPDFSREEEVVEVDGEVVEPLDEEDIPFGDPDPPEQQQSIPTEEA